MDDKIIYLAGYIKGMGKMMRKDIDFVNKAKGILERSKEIDIPIDPINIANYNDIDVYAIEFTNENISGVISKKDNKTTILVNENESYNRQRFTVAHELGHYFLHMNEDKTYEELYRDGRSTLEEVEANKLGAELLMPSEKVINKFNEIIALKKSEKEIISHLSDLFKVSEEAMGYKLMNLGLIRG